MRSMKVFVMLFVVALVLVAFNAPAAVQAEGPATPAATQSAVAPTPAPVGDAPARYVAIDDLGKWIGVAAFFFMFAFLFSSWNQNRTVMQLVEAMKAVNANKDLLDNQEKLVLGTVPRETAEGAYQVAHNALNVLKAFAPDAVDKLADQADAYVRKITDGQPNDPPNPVQESPNG